LQRKWFSKRHTHLRIVVGHLVIVVRLRRIFGSIYSWRFVRLGRVRKGHVLWDFITHLIGKLNVLQYRIVIFGGKDKDGSILTTGNCAFIPTKHSRDNNIKSYKNVIIDSYYSISEIKVFQCLLLIFKSHVIIIKV